VTLILVFFVFAGGLFHPEDDRQEVAFKYAVDRINADRSILPRSRLTAQIERISPQDSFHASKRGQLYEFNQTSKVSLNVAFPLRYQNAKVCADKEQEQLAKEDLHRRFTPAKRKTLE